MTPSIWSMTALTASCVFDDEQPLCAADERPARRAQLMEEIARCVQSKNADRAGFAVALARRDLGWFDSAVQESAGSVLDLLVKTNQLAIAYRAASEAVVGVRGVGGLDRSTFDIEILASQIARQQGDFAMARDCATRAYWISLIVNGRSSVRSQQAYDILVDSIAASGHPGYDTRLLDDIRDDICREESLDPSLPRPSIHGVTLANVEADIWHLGYLRWRQTGQTDDMLWASWSVDGVSPLREIRLRLLLAKQLSMQSDTSGSTRQLDSALSTLSQQTSIGPNFRTNWMCEAIGVYLALNQVATATALCARWLESQPASELQPLVRLSQDLTIAAVSLENGEHQLAMSALQRVRSVVDQLPSPLEWMRPTLLSNIAVGEIVAGDPVLAREHLEHAKGLLRSRTSALRTPDLLARVAVEYNLARCDEVAGQPSDAVQRLSDILGGVVASSLHEEPIVRHATAYLKFLMQNYPSAVPVKPLSFDAHITAVSPAAWRPTLRAA